MGDFFTRLAERTLGLAPVVQPDLMPVLAPMAETEFVSDSLPGLEHTLERGTTPASKAAPLDADSISQNFGTTEIATLAGEVPQGLTQDWHQRAVLPARAARAVDWQSVPPMGEPSAVESPRPMTEATPSVVELDGNHLNSEFKPGEQTSPAENRQSPHASAVMAQTKPSEVKPTATPTIQISIGSVEIRAVTPAPALGSQRPAERRGNPRLSLEEYLRQRNEGRR